MDEKEQKEAEAKAAEEAKKKADEEPAKAKNDGSKYETTPVIERAREEREKLEVATAAQKVENDRSEQIMARRALGGDSEAGQAPQEKQYTDEEKASRARIKAVADSGGSEWGKKYE